MFRACAATLCLVAALVFGALRVHPAERSIITHASAHDTVDDRQDRVGADAIVRTTLRASFANNGSAGYFVETPGALTGGLDLYTTTWWLAAEPRLRARLDVPAVEQWARSIVIRPAAASNDGLAPFLRVLLAARILRSLGLANNVVVSPGRLSDLVAGRKVSWATLIRHNRADDTLVSQAAAAVHLLITEAVAVPQSLSDYLDQVTAQGLTAGSRSSVGRTTAALSAASRDFVRAHRIPIRRYLSAAVPRLKALPLLYRIGLASQLVGVASRVGLKWDTGQFCDSSTLADQIAREGDPQFVYDARLLGCNPSVTPAPFTSLGWPGVDELQDTLLSTVDGVKVALSLGQLGSYRRPLIRELTADWEPHIRSMGRNAPLSDRLAVLMLGHFLGVHVTETRPSSRQIQTGRTSWSGYLTLAPLMQLQGYKPPLLSHSVLEELEVASPDAAAMVLKAEVMTDAIQDSSAIAARERALLTRCTDGRGLYFLVPPSSAALWGTLGAAWVQGIPLLEGTLKANGLLLPDGQFQDRVAGRPITQPWLQVQAALATVDSRVYPLILSVFL